MFLSLYKAESGAFSTVISASGAPDGGVELLEAAYFDFSLENTCVINDNTMNTLK